MTPAEQQQPAKLDDSDLREAITATMYSVLMQLIHHMSNLPQQTPGRLEIGWLALGELRRRSGAPEHLSGPPSAFGVPVVERIDLPPWAWRLLDVSGEVIQEGNIALRAVT